MQRSFCKPIFVLLVQKSVCSQLFMVQAVWIQVPQSVKNAVENLNYSFRGGLHAAGHALLNVVPL